jgi:SpoVK/Ycf46/Vps4 family AAA+-type ATPase
MRHGLSEFTAVYLACRGNLKQRLRILRVLCAKLRLDGAFDFNALAKATPGYVGADLSALTGAAGIIAVKHIFKTLSDGPSVIPDTSMSTVDTDAFMQIDAHNQHLLPSQTLLRLHWALVPDLSHDFQYPSSHIHPSHASYALIPVP